MEEADFEDLIQSLREAKAIMNGELPAGRRWLVTDRDGVVTRTRLDLPVAPSLVRPKH